MSTQPPDSGNVYEIPLSPEAQEALAKATALRQAVDEMHIQRIYYTTDSIERGETEWQKTLKSRVDALYAGEVTWAEDLAAMQVRQTNLLTTIVDDLHVIRRTRLLWPSILSLACLFLGGASATFVIHFLSSK